MRKKMKVFSKNNSIEYWNQNIDKWGKLYLRASHPDERLNAPKWFEYIYHRVVTPIEAKLMTQRYELTINFINQHVKSGMVVVDLGCGTGIFTVEMLRRGANVIAVDYAQSSLDLTKKAVEKLVPDLSCRIQYLLADITNQKLPFSDVVLIMGVTPYVLNINAFFNNILPNTKKIYCLFINPEHWINKLRKLISILNVRKLNFYNMSIIDGLYRQHNWKLIDRQLFATGYLDLAVISNEQNGIKL